MDEPSGLKAMLAISSAPERRLRRESRGLRKKRREDVRQPVTASTQGPSVRTRVTVSPGLIVTTSSFVRPNSGLLSVIVCVPALSCRFI